MVKAKAPEYFKTARKWIGHVKHGADWVTNMIDNNRDSFRESAGVLASSGVKPFTAVGEYLQDHEHHIDGVHSLTGQISDYSSKAHTAVDKAEEGFAKFDSDFLGGAVSAK